MSTIALTSSIINMINSEISLPEIVIRENAELKVWARLQKLNCDLYERRIEFDCEVYTLDKVTRFQTISREKILVTNTSYRPKVVDSAGNPVMQNGVQAEIGNFDYIYKVYFEGGGLKAAVEAALTARFTGAKNPLPAFVQK